MTTVHKIKEVLTLNKAAYVGMCILDLRKALICDIKEKYDHKTKSLCADTDSLFYEIEANDVHEDFYMNKDMFDFSEYPDNLRFYVMKSKKIIGKMKDEAKGLPTEFVGLKSKMYSYMRKIIREAERQKELIKTLLKIWIMKNLVHGIGAKLVSNWEQTCYVPKISDFSVEK